MNSKERIVQSVKSYTAVKPYEIDHTTRKGLIQSILLGLKRVDMSGLGAQLAYFFLLSFFPLLIFLVTLLPYLNLKLDQVYDFINEMLPDEIFLMVEDILGQVLTTPNGGLLSIGIIGTLWTASKGVGALMKALNRAYDVEEKAGILSRIWSLIFTIAFVVIILSALVLPIFGQQIVNVIFSYLNMDSDIGLGPIWTFIQWCMPLLLIFILMLVVYWVVPNTNPKIKLRSVWPGALVATMGWFALTYGFSYYINNFGNYNATYGSIGGVIVLMLWLYFTGMILIFGGIVNASVEQRTRAILTKKSTKTPQF